MTRSRVSRTTSVAAGSRRLNFSAAVPASVFDLKSVVTSSVRCVATNAETFAYYEGSFGIVVGESLVTGWEPLPQPPARIARRAIGANLVILDR
jgi:hypothetical protein